MFFLCHFFLVCSSWDGTQGFKSAKYIFYHQAVVRALPFPSYLAYITWSIISISCHYQKLLLCSEFWLHASNIDEFFIHFFISRISLCIKGWSQTWGPLTSASWPFRSYMCALLHPAFSQRNCRVSQTRITMNSW